MLGNIYGDTASEDWIIIEDEFDCDYLKKSESIFALGNGYLGLRSTNEEEYLNSKRGMFVSGIFDKFFDEVSELVNIPDITNLNIKINGNRFNLNYGKIKAFTKCLNMQTGELRRSITWISPDGNKIYLNFYRIISMHNKHLIGNKVEIKSNDVDLEIEVESGINGRITNTGTQHCSEKKIRIYDEKYLRYLTETNQSDIDIDIYSTHNFSKDSEDYDMDLQRRYVGIKNKIKVDRRETLVIEKISSVYTSFDEEVDKNDRINEINKSYDELFNDHKKTWLKLWDDFDVKIYGSHFDQLAVRFAIYHMLIMAPHSEMFGIGAKGLTGEGYKGHSFWDTEIYILPFFTFCYPEKAKNLLKYRYKLLDKAKINAKERGYEGAMYPWESASTDEGDQTPKFAIVDTKTGKPTEVLSGSREHHISADIAYAIDQYYKITNDIEFMNKYGFEMIFEIANFWASRLEYNDKKERYELTKIIGPDEYNENASNNAFTNYMAHFSIDKAIEFSELVDKDFYNCINLEDWKEKVDNIYLPGPNEDDLIPQDDEYLNKKEIDITKYKESLDVDTIFKDYNLEDLSNYQVTKQADVVMLMNLLNEKFNIDTMRKNFEFYETKTLHDSSLSLSMHAMLASKIGLVDKAYQLFESASRIDLGQNMTSSNEGVHAASLGGLWQAIVLGFSGLKIKDDEIKLNPNLPHSWMSLEYKIKIKGIKYRVVVTSNDYDVIKID